MQLELQLDSKNYNEEDLISIKVATHLPYYNDSKEFRRTDGSIELDGIEYKYVKKRFYNDSLELLCIPNIVKMAIKDSKNEFSKLVNDFQELGFKKKQTRHFTSIKPLGAEYCKHHFILNLNGKDEILIEKTLLGYTQALIKTVAHSPQEPPPDISSTILAML